MRRSNWDILAPGYWTDPQRRAVEAAVRARLPARARPRAASRFWAWGAAAICIGLIACMLHDWRQSHPATFDASLGSGLAWLICSFLADVGGVLALAFPVLAVIALLVLGVVRLSSVPFRTSAGAARRLRLWPYAVLDRTAVGELDAWLAADFRARVDHWSRLLRSSPRSRSDYMASLQQMHWVGRFLSVFSTGGIVLGIFAQRAAETLGLGVRSLPLFFAALIGALILYSRQLWLLRKRLRGALAQANCPDCGYDLRGCEPGVDPARLDGLFIGPERCPECGSLWPLLPPPLSPTGCLLPPAARPKAQETPAHER